MTASNMLVLNDGVALFSDSAGYTHDGVVRDFKHKALISADRKWGVAFMGPLALRDLVEPTLSMDFDTFTDVAGVVLKGFAAFSDHGALTFAGWSERKGKWTGYTVQSWSDGDDCAVKPFEPHEMWAAIRPEIRKGGELVEFGALDIPTHIRERGLLDFGRALFLGQRHSPAWELPDGRQINVVVGGDCYATIITSNGVETRLCHSWPDKLGDGAAEREAQPRVEPDFVMRPQLTRAERRRQAREQRRAA